MRKQLQKFVGAIVRVNGVNEVYIYVNIGEKKETGPDMKIVEIDEDSIVMDMVNDNIGFGFKRWILPISRIKGIYIL